MIIQGSNEPIRITFDVVPLDVSVTLSNEIEILKHWDMANLTCSSDNLVFSAPFTQEESMAWEEGPCEIIVRWTDSTGDMAGIVQTARQSNDIIYCSDRQELSEE